MKVFHSPDHAGHCPESFYTWGQFIAWTPDPPARADRILEALQRDGHEALTASAHGLRPISDVHTPEYLQYLESAWTTWQAAAHDASTRLIKPVKDIYPLIHPVHGIDRRYPSSIVARAGYHAADMWMPIGDQTWKASVSAADLAVEAADVVSRGEPAAYALCRPSGHHAYRDKGGGNCYLNNAAIAAQYLRRTMYRVAIIDIDVHHGNGTQGVFYDRDDVLFVSLHCDPDDCYPYFVGYDSERGEGAGLGYNFNLPLPSQSGDEVYLPALEQACARISAFQPDALVVSLGVDAHEDDLNRALRITFEGFHRIGARLGALGLPTVLIQEGGYNLKTIGYCVANVLAGFEGRDLHLTLDSLQ